MAAALRALRRLSQALPGLAWGGACAAWTAALPSLLAQPRRLLQRPPPLRPALLALGLAVVASTATVLAVTMALMMATSATTQKLAATAAAMTTTTMTMPMPALIRRRRARASGRGEHPVQAATAAAPAVALACSAWDWDWGWGSDLDSRVQLSVPVLRAVRPPRLLQDLQQLLLVQLQHLAHLSPSGCLSLSSCPRRWCAASPAAEAMQLQRAPQRSRRSRPQRRLPVPPHAAQHAQRGRCWTLPRPLSGLSSRSRSLSLPSWPSQQMLMMMAALQVQAVSG